MHFKLGLKSGFAPNLILCCFTNDFSCLRSDFLFLSIEVEPECLDLVILVVGEGRMFYDECGRMWIGQGKHLRKPMVISRD